MKKTTKLTKKEIPLPIKIIAVFQYIGAGFGLLGAAILFLAAFSAGAKIIEIPVIGIVSATVFFIGAIIFLTLSLLAFFVARSLWIGKKWARIICIIFTTLGLAGAITTAIVDFQGALMSIAFNGLILGYLLFNKDVQKAFS